MFTPFIRSAAPVLVLLTLAACAGGPGRAPELPGSTGMYGETKDQSASENTTPGMSQPVKVAMLLPLTGKNASMGIAMQNAATLALNDLGYPNFELLFEDTQSTAGGAEKAARHATDSGARLLIGPIVAEEAKAARPEAQRVGASMMTFSTDVSVAAPKSFVMGILPHDQARQIARFAASKNLKKILVVAQRDAYGQIVTNAFMSAAQGTGATVIGPLWIDGNITTLPAQLATYFPANQPASIDAVFMPLPAERAGRLSRMLKAIPEATAVTRLGTGLLDDANVTVYPDLVGTYYAAPSPQARTRFEQAYTKNFGDKPPRLASLGYDAVALSLMLGRTSGPDGLTADSLSNPNGFTGIDGLFRFLPNGMVERGLAIIKIEPGSRVIALPPPASFVMP